MTVAYLLTLILSLGAMVLLDHRYRLFFWRSPVRAAIVLAAGVAYFLLWDLFGIGLGIFYRGETTLMTGLLLAPELPVEEFFFLTFLCYLTMNAVQGAGLLLAARAARAARASRPARPDEGTHG